MTFEEFLIKKKIDAIQLKDKDQAFFSEFESHFLQMGEKSFDHSKKFWFNKLRRAYHLKEEPKPVKEEAKIDEIPASAQNKSVNEAINLEKPAYVPRFKAASAQKADQSAQNIESDPTPAYVPRFKAAIKTAEKEEDTSQNKEESEEKAKPIYKPRFKAQIPAQEEKLPEMPAEAIPQSDEPAAKPAYKPRFKPGLTKKNPETE
ncbi:MAG: hypothetical protein B7X86_07960 [Sphingobacteriales bacterium 17-39-43]|uniref:hypothetical protein n=1 Tax=Daejeonella sp. TaxID=2805397 RepID=UPI000BCA7ECB|nr:hypothetical protein [Daejeonella sp.]OYZ31498.1 MAG: hypothetical protein B7Y24_08770 [Sphingobacteriales bacterium 16-39-50]OZA24696.1 MAG: hypothetical protein B7X86_07960 [Sphingobacteriales bacterium 17-39-43]HQT22663.1 hypothetical protein [Daejeonella sp.]HQT57647.1 hypothetical protein [Daejeonella sp.]